MIAPRHGRLAAACVLLAVVGPWATPGVAVAGSGAVPAVQVVATLTSSHVTYASPRGARTGSVSDRRPITGETTVLPVTAEADLAGTRWLDVLLPGRPNGHTGWIRQSGTQLGVIRWHIVVSIRRRLARVYYSGRLRRTFQVIVGKPSSPTPTGGFFVEENIAEPSSFPGAPYALALSARSDVYTEFDQGPGQIALHGVEGLGGTLGQAESHGCVRFSTAAITWLAARIAPGTPVTIES